MILYFGLVAALLICAVMVIRASRLMGAALWLAAVSVLVSLLLYLLGAPQVAALELSIGAGLVTVLIVLAISIAGDDALRAAPVVPRWTAFGLAAGALLAFVAAIFPPTAVDVAQPASAAAPVSLGVVLWQQRTADVLLQAALMFTALMTVLGLLAEMQTTADAHTHTDGSYEQDSDDDETAPAAPVELPELALEAEKELV